VVERPGKGAKSWSVTESGSWRARTAAGVNLGPPTFEAMVEMMAPGVRVAALVKDYGIAKGLSGMMKPLMMKLIAALSKDDVESVKVVRGKRLTGKLLDFASSRIPDEVREALEGYTYEIKFVDRPSGYLHDAGYAPSRELVQVEYNMGMPSWLKAAGEWGSIRRTC